MNNSSKIRKLCQFLCSPVTYLICDSWTAIETLISTVMHNRRKIQNAYTFFSALLSKFWHVTFGSQLKQLISTAMNNNYFHDLDIIGTPTSPAHWIRSKKYRLLPIQLERARFPIRYQIPHIANKLNLVEMSQSFTSRFSLKKHISKIILCLDVGID